MNITKMKMPSKGLPVNNKIYFYNNGAEETINSKIFQLAEQTTRSSGADIKITSYVDSKGIIKINQQEKSLTDKIKDFIINIVK